MGLDSYKVLTFNCYGTLIDWETGIWDASQPLIADNGRSDVTRTQVLSLFARHEHALEMENPTLTYPEILAKVHAGMAEDLGARTTTGLNRAFSESVPHWPAFGDSAEALRFLKTRYRLVVLSNVDRQSFAASQRKLGVQFDAVCTAEEIGSYKPSPRNFRYMLDRLASDLGLGRETVLHTAQSLLHDHAPARALGISNAWIDRQRL